MNANLTEIVLILDRSGSMSGLEADMVGGVNDLIAKQRAEPGEAILSTVFFNTSSVVLHNRADLRQTTPLTLEDYRVDGGTALLDAVGDAIRHIGLKQKHTPEAERPARTLFVIATDGYENASHRHTADSVRADIERQKTKYGWEFIFLGANIDAVQVADRYGIGAERAVDFHADACGVRRSYETVDRALHELRSSKRQIGTAWRKAADEDFRGRTATRR